MRTTFVQTVLALAKERPNMMLVTGDLGFTVLEEFRDTLPKQYLNAGVMEQNMIGVAAGLAMSGREVFVYSIIPFVTFRCLEQIRNDVCYHRLPVYLVGVGGGYSYGHMGSTHHALEDIAILRSLPNMSVVCPGDPVETGELVRAAAERKGPCYIRLGKAGEPKLHKEPLTLTLGKAIRLREGRDVTVIATGNMLETAVQLGDALRERSVDARVVSMHTVKPLDSDEVHQCADETPLIVTIEEHSRIGGLGSAVAETLSERKKSPQHLLCAAPDAFAPLAGSQQYFRKLAGLTVPALCEKVTQALADRAPLFAMRT